MRTFLVAAALTASLAACSPQAPEDAADAGPASPADAVPPDARPEPPVAQQPEAMPATDPDAGAQGGTDDWRTVAVAEDADRLSRLDQAWRLGRAEAEDNGHAAEVAALGALVDPAAALTGRLQPAPGTYRCRSIRLGSHDGNGLGYLAYPWFRCSVELTPGGDLILTKTTGSQRTRGRLYPDADDRLVFVGAQAWGDDERTFPSYSDNPERDQIGVLERIGDQRWRLVLPWPKQSSKLDIIELTR